MPISATRLTIETLLGTGQLAADAARDLRNRVGSIEKKIAEGDGDRAEEEIKKFRDKIDDLRKDRKLSVAGHLLLTVDLDRIAALVVAGDD